MINNRQSGFSLLEILVAFSILALSLGILFQSFSLGVRNAKVANEYTIAVMLAQQQMALLGTTKEITEGQDNGEFEGFPKYHFTTHVSEFIYDPGQEVISGIQFRLMKIELSVLWGKRNKPKKFKLETLRMVRKS